MPNFTPISAGMGEWGPKNLKNFPIFSKFWNINGPEYRHIPHTIFTKLTGLMGSFPAGNVLKFRGIRSRGSGVMGV